MSLVEQLINWIIIISYPCLLLLLYTRFTIPIRFILQYIFIAPIILFCSTVVTLIGLIIKYLTFQLVSNATRQYLLSFISSLFWNTAFFLFEFWPNNRYVISDENISDDIFYLNNMLLCNHSASPFDWLTLGSISDAIDRFQNTFMLAKKEMGYVPGIGWVGSLGTAILLNRNWEKDKRQIADLCNEFKKKEKGQFKYTAPWCFALYPEGTRFTHKKFLKAQQFAKERGLTVYDNLLQPRVKGFSYLAHHLHDVLGCVIDVTCVYHPKPPSGKKFFLYTRTAKYTHLHLKVYRQSDIPKDIQSLNQWLRDRWDEKDKIVKQMQDKKIKYQILKRSPYNAMKYYVLWAIITNYLILNLYANISFLPFALSLISSIFPAVIVGIEHSQDLDV